MPVSDLVRNAVTRARHFGALGGVVLLAAGPAPACNDYYSYVNAPWIRAHAVPAGQDAVDDFDATRRQNLRELVGLLTRAQAHERENRPAIRLAGTLFSSCMNLTAIERAGPSPLVGELRRISAIHDRASLALQIARLHDEQIPVFFDAGYGFSASGGNDVITEVDPEPVTERDDAALEAVTTSDRAPVVALKKYALALFSQVDRSPAMAATEAQAAVQLRLRFAAAGAAGAAATEHDRALLSWQNVERYAPGFDWHTYGEARSLPKRTAVRLLNDVYVRVMNRIVRTTSLAALKSYIRFDFLANQAPYLSSPFRRIDDAPITAGDMPVTEPRSETCAEATQSLLPREVAQLWRTTHDVSALEQRAGHVAEAVRTSMLAALRRATWISKPLRDALADRLERVRIAFESQAPPVAEQPLVLSPNQFQANAMAIMRRRATAEIRAIGLPITGSGLLEIEPTDTDPSYIPDFNVITVSWGFLRSPILPKTPSVAGDFGTFGAMIGHEFMHVLDPGTTVAGGRAIHVTQGDARRYRQRVACLTQQLGNQRDDDGARVRAADIADEAYADLGGMQAAYLAMHGDRASSQRFFASFAKIHASVEDRYAISWLRKNDEHPPDRLRVNATLSNMPEFAALFNCNVRAPMARPRPVRCTAW